MGTSAKLPPPPPRYLYLCSIHHNAGTPQCTSPVSQTSDVHRLPPAHAYVPPSLPVCVCAQVEGKWRVNKEHLVPYHAAAQRLAAKFFETRVQPGASGGW